MKNKTFKLLSDYRTLIMGIAMISILLFHYTEDCFYSPFMYKGVVKIYKELIGSVGVDLFLLMSGLGMYYSLSKSDKIVEFYKKRLIRILIPFFIIAIPTLIWVCIKSNLDITYFFKELFFIKLANNPNHIIERYSKFFGMTSLLILFLIIISKYDKNKVINFIKKVIEFFGKYSLEIYLIHVSARKVLYMYNLKPYHIQYYLVYVGVAIILAPLVNKLAKLIENKISMIGKKGIVSEN